MNDARARGNSRISILKVEGVVWYGGGVSMTSSGVVHHGLLFNVVKNIFPDQGISSYMYCCSSFISVYVIFLYNEF